MPKVGMNQEFKLTTRNSMTSCDCTVELIVDGKELPTMALLGALLEEAIETIQAKITESYKVIPGRV